MEESLTSRRSVVAAVFIAMIFIIVSLGPSIKSFMGAYFNIESETVVVFCDVGQGDATYIRLANKTDVLIDAGPDRKVLQCLGKYMPFFDKTIEIAIISHPQKDHFGGFEHILDRYSIDLLILNSLNNKALSFQKLLKKLDQKKVKLKSLYMGDVIDLNNAKINIYWPKRSYLEKSIYKTTTVNNGFRVNDVLLNLNKFSYVFTFEEDNKSILFTGDIDKEISNKISSSLGQVDILKVPHHGSKNGVTKKFIDKVKPKISIINVGKNNSYGHPHKEILDLLNSVNSQIRRTDEDGDIVIKIQ